MNEAANEREKQGDLPTEQKNDETEQPVRDADKARQLPQAPDGVVKPYP